MVLVVTPEQMLADGVRVLLGRKCEPPQISLRLLSVAGLVDEQQKVRTISALAIAALAEAATPYGIESFDSVLKPLWKGIRQHRGKVSPAEWEVKIRSARSHPALSLSVAAV